jgi:hypothetical protein
LQLSNGRLASAVVDPALGSVRTGKNWGKSMLSKSIWLAIRLCAAVAATSTLGACATIVSGTSQNVSVTTDPDGANCKMEREGQVVGIVNPTPGTVRIEKSKNDITITCKKEGYADTQAPLSSSFTGTTFGNILFGGLVGVAIDASSGANNKYPESAFVILTPSRFNSVQARDEYYDKVRDRVNVNAAEAVNKLKTQCAADRKEQCAIDIKKVEDERDRQLKEVENRRQQAPMAS